MVTGGLLVGAAVATIVPFAHADSLEDWGYNSSGQLGNGTTTNSPSPVRPIGLTSSVSAVAGGAGSGFAIQGGALFGWGDNGNGNLGNGTTVSPTVPLVTLLVSGVTAVSSGAFHTLALQNGALYAVGYNVDGELGSGTAGGRTSTFSAVLGMGSGVSSFSAGLYHSLAVNNGGVYAWGGEYGGELGDGTSSGAANPTPTAVAGLSTGVTAVAAGHSDSFAIQGGALYAWGSDLYGQLGTGDASAGYFSTTPAAVTSLSSGVTSVAAGQEFTLAVANGKVYVWGNNGYGEFGNGTTSSSTTNIDSDVPLLVPGITGTITEVAAGDAASYALSSTGSLWVWGVNVYGELGLGYTSTDVTTPTQMFAPAGYEFTSVESNTNGNAAYVTLAPVPEPATLTLLGLATIPMLGARRRRN